MKWWESGQRSIEDEEAWFRAGGYSFTLDRQTLDADGVVVFGGELHYDGQTCPASVVYPAAYAAGHNPTIVAPGLPIDRHKDPNGVVCLDHPSPDGEPPAPMTGAEAVRLAEELWRLSVEDPAALHDAEADAPDPRVEQYAYQQASAIYAIDVDVTGHDEGYFRLGLSSAQPLRGALTGLGAGITDGQELPLPEQNLRFAGPVAAHGVWRRVGRRPPGPEMEKVVAWAESEMPDLLAKAHVLATVRRQMGRQAGLPAVVGIVFPDEGPQRDEFHDEWLIISLPPGQPSALVRTYSIRAAEHWLRQPQLKPLGDKRVGLAGSGALGSQMGGLLARAGLGDLATVDHDFVSPGNRVRHEGDLGDLGLAKIAAAVRRVTRVNPYINATGHGVRLGAAGGAHPGIHQRAENAALADLANRDLLINATANIPTGYWLSAWADSQDMPVLHVMVSSGAWSGRILLQRHSHSGCLECLARHQDRPVAGSPEIPSWTEDPNFPQVLDLGCGQPSFTGPGFEITETAAAAVRVAVQSLLAGEGYPAADFDLVTLVMRDATSARPQATYSRMPRHADCESCTA